VAWFLDTNTIVFCLRGKSPAFILVWPDAAVEDHYVAVRTHLEALGTPIGEADLWIAATARASGGTLVTNNTREFYRVPNLSVEDWTIP
jgi:tRNA(fMet)-specific endonuclease VapC